MEIEFTDSNLDSLETDPTAGDYSEAIIKAYRKRIQTIRAAVDERDLYVMKGHRFEKLKGDRSHQHSMRLNDQMRLILEIKPSTPKNIIIVVGIEDYH